LAVPLFSNLDGFLPYFGFEKQSNEKVQQKVIKQQPQSSVAAKPFYSF
jgi:hypothetical protein